MTHTVQSNSEALSAEQGETTIDINSLLSIYDGMNKLYMALSRLNNNQINLCNKINRLDDIMRKL